MSSVVVESKTPVNRANLEIFLREKYRSELSQEEIANPVTEEKPPTIRFINKFLTPEKRNPIPIKTNPQTVIPKTKTPV